MPIRSIRGRMTFAFALAVALLMTAVCGGLVWIMRRSAERSADRLLATAAARLREELSTLSVGGEITPEILEAERDLRADGLALFIAGGSTRPGGPTPGRLPVWQPRDDAGWRTTTVSLPGRRELVLALPWRRTDESLKQQARTLAGLGLLVVAVSAAGAWALVGRTLNPILTLAEQARSASPEARRPRLVAPSGDFEVTELVSTLNGLLERVEELAESRGRFYAAASHELRTPLQALSGHLELAISRERSGDEYREALAEARRQTARLIRLVQDLLFLSQVESRPGGGALETVDLADLCERIVGGFAAALRERGVTVAMDLADDACIRAPGTHAHVLLRNLVENAVKYARSGSVIRLATRAADGGIETVLSNACEPLSPTALARLFEPFYRPDESRSAETGGNGLGLAICKAICDANGWRIRLEQAEGGIVVTVQFPATP